MQKVKSHKYMVAGVLMVAGVIAYAANAGAATYTADTTATIKQALSFEEVSSLKFGNYNKPSDGSNTYTLAASNGGVTSEGTGDGNYIDGAEAGDYTLSGEVGQSVDVSVTMSDSDDADGVDFTSADIDGSTETVNVSLDESDGTATLNIGGEITITDEAELGERKGTITLEANYQ